jgi:hypothetical protein
MTDALVRLQEEKRTRRRSIADVVGVVSRFDPPTDPIGRIQICPLRLPRGDRTYLVEVAFPKLGCVVSLPTSARFKARSMTHSLREGDIRLLSDAKVYSDGTVALRNGKHLRAVEVVPSYLPYEPSPLDLRILRYVIALTGADYCYRSIRENLPVPYRDMVPDVCALDFGRVANLRVPYLKVIKAYIEDHDPALAVSSQKIADALAAIGVRRPRRRRARTPSAAATI